MCTRTIALVGHVDEGEAMHVQGQGQLELPVSYAVTLNIYRHFSSVVSSHLHQ